MNLNLFEDKRNNNNFLNEFIDELKNHLRLLVNKQNEKIKIMNEYDLYETKKIFLDNKSYNGNDFAWIMDNKSVCVSQHGDGGPYWLHEINLPPNSKVGEVYEKINGKYVLNKTVTMELNNITTPQ